jgi:hypothetical protein
MPTKISYTLRATFDEVKKYKVIDLVCQDVVVFDDFLESGETRAASSCADSAGGSSGRVSHQRSNGPLVETDVSDGDTIDLD